MYIYTSVRYRCFNRIACDSHVANEPDKKQNKTTEVGCYNEQNGRMRSFARLLSIIPPNRSLIMEKADRSIHTAAYPHQHTHIHTDRMHLNRLTIAIISVEQFIEHNSNSNDRKMNNMFE